MTSGPAYQMLALSTMASKGVTLVVLGKYIKHSLHMHVNFIETEIKQ